MASFTNRDKPNHFNVGHELVITLRSFLWDMITHSFPKREWYLNYSTSGVRNERQMTSHKKKHMKYTLVHYIPGNMHTVFALLCFVVVIHWLIFPYPSGLLHWHCGNLTIAPVAAKQPWWLWINTSCEFIMNDCITTTKQSTTKPRAYFLGYTVHARIS